MEERIRKSSLLQIGILEENKEFSGRIMYDQFPELKDMKPQIKVTWTIFPIYPFTKYFECQTLCQAWQIQWRRELNRIRAQGCDWKLRTESQGASREVGIVIGTI